MQSLVVIPTYNEQATLLRVVERTVVHDVDVLIVDDNSTDGTAELADVAVRRYDRVHVLHRAGKLGLGSAYRDGFAWGLERTFDVLCAMDADLSHDPADVPMLIAALKHADLVVGSRYVPGGKVVGWPVRRQALSRGGNLYVRAFTGCPVRDATGGFRAYRAKVIDSLNIPDVVASEGYAFQIEMVLRAWEAGFDLDERPITFTERAEGVSKMNKRIIWEALRLVPMWRREATAPRPAVQLGTR